MKSYEEFKQRAKAILCEDAGCEGAAYLLKYKGTLKEDPCFSVEDKVDGQAKIIFDYPRDYGFALQTLTSLGIEVIGLELLY